MKKLLISALALASLVACSKEEVLKQQDPTAIQFDQVFVDNSTRAAVDNSYTKDKLAAFDVYGKITNKNDQSTNIFNKELVSKSTVDGNTVWSYAAENTQYWLPTNTYNFTAIADGNVVVLGADGVADTKVTEVITGDFNMPVSIELYDASAQRDILYAVSEPIDYASGEKTVGFTFSHLMSKAKFTFSNKIATNSGYSYRIKNVAVTNASKKASYKIGQGWISLSDSYNLSFGDVVEEVTTDGVKSFQLADLGYNESSYSNYERLLIPTDVTSNTNITTVTVQFTYEVYKNNILIDTQTKNVSADVKLLAGNSYNFQVNLGNPGEPIKFTVLNVSGWIEGGSPSAK